MISRYGDGGVCGASNTGQYIFGGTDHIEFLGGNSGVRLDLLM